MQPSLLVIDTRVHNYIYFSEHEINSQTFYLVVKKFTINTDQSMLKSLSLNLQTQIQKNESEKGK